MKKVILCVCTVVIVILAAVNLNLALENRDTNSGKFLLGNLKALSETEEGNQVKEDEQATGEGCFIAKKKPNGEWELIPGHFFDCVPGRSTCKPSCVAY